jgi:hypothetical protein
LTLKSLIYKPNFKLIAKALITKTIRLSMFVHKLLITHKTIFKTILIINKFMTFSKVIKALKAVYKDLY